MDAERIEQLLRLAVHLAPADLLPLAASDIDILGDGEIRAERDLLIDRADAEFLRILRRIDADDLIRELNDARILRVDAGQHLDQSRFARAVFAHQRMNFTGKQLEADVLQCLNAREGFEDVLHGQYNTLFAHF